MRPQKDFDLPGMLFQRQDRWWWKVKLPGDLRTRSRALRPAGERLATGDYHQGRQIAINLWQQALYLADPPPQAEVTSIASLAAAYLKHCDKYYLDAQGSGTKRPGRSGIQ